MKSFTARELADALITAGERLERLNAFKDKPDSRVPTTGDPDSWLDGYSAAMTDVRDVLAGRRLEHERR